MCKGWAFVRKVYKMHGDNRFHLGKTHCVNANALRHEHTHTRTRTLRASGRERERQTSMGHTMAQTRAHNNNRTNCITHYFWLLFYMFIHICFAFIVLPQLLYFWIRRTNTCVGKRECYCNEWIGCRSRVMHSATKQNNTHNHTLYLARDNNNFGSMGKSLISSFKIRICRQPVHLLDISARLWLYYLLCMYARVSILCVCLCATVFCAWVRRARYSMLGFVCKLEVVQVALRTDQPNTQNR